MAKVEELLDVLSGGWFVKYSDNFATLPIDKYEALRDLAYEVSDEFS